MKARKKVARHEAVVPISASRIPERRHTKGSDISDSRSGDRTKARRGAFAEEMETSKLYSNEENHARIKFGKYTGTRWREIPGGYLMFLIRVGHPSGCRPAGREMARRRKVKREQ